MEDTVREFEKHRPVLLGLAYRLLGSMWDAEDVVQDAYLRWTGVDRSQIRDSRAFLVTVVSRLALDQLRSTRVTRESYRGPWLPEPVFTGALGPLDTAELRDTISYATMHLMERLAPPERAVFVLREAFGLPYEDIAQAVGTSTANCRQMYHRARRHLAGERDRFHPSPKEHLRLLTAFLHAAQNGDLAELTRILAEDVTAWNDGGGTVRAALHPIVGRPKVLAFVAGLRSRYGIGPARLVEVNGEAAAWAEVDGQQQLITVDVRSGRICAIFAVLNPAKLAHVSPESTP